MKKNKSNLTPTTNYFDVFNTYKEKKASVDLITYEELMASVLFDNKLGFESEVYLDFVKKFTLAFEKKLDIWFENFIINFNLNLKFSTTIMIPILVTKANSTTDAINFRNDQNPVYNNFLISYNQKIKKLLLQNHPVQILPHLILFKSNLNGSLALVFSEKIIASIEQKSGN